MELVFPLTHRELVRGCAEHVAAGLGCAADYTANYEPLYAPCDGHIYEWGGPLDQGGFWIRVYRDDGFRYEMAHLSEYRLASGTLVMRNERIATTGNSGTLTTGPHLHLQVLDPHGNRVDPVAHFQGASNAMSTENQDIEGQTVIENPGGHVGFFKGGKLHRYNDAWGVDFPGVLDRYFLNQTADYISATRFAGLPRGTLTAEQVFRGQRDW